MKKRILAAILSIALVAALLVYPGFAEEACTYPVSFLLTPNDASLTVSAGIGYTYLEDVIPPIASAEQESQTLHLGEEATEPKPAAQRDYTLAPGNYTATITKEGYYAAVFSFTVAQNGKITAVDNKGNVKDYLQAGVFSIALDVFTPSQTENAWDGVTLDVSWYEEDAKQLTVYTAAQFADMAAIVNGIYNAEITTILDDADADGIAEAYTPVEYAALENRKIRAKSSVSGTGSNNLVTTDTYWYGVKCDGTTPADFNGQTVLLANDLDMGGWQKDGSWTGARYMSIGGQSLMHYIAYSAQKSDGFSHLGSSFNGTLDGQGHMVQNVYCDRYGAGTNYGDSSSVGLVGRLGCHDNDATTLMAVNPTVRNLGVTGYIYGRRSVGGIVGKFGRTSADRLGDGSIGCIVENCLNYAAVCNTDAKGCGGIVGASWNKGVIRYCANFGTVSSSYTCPTGGISGSNEVKLESCYNVGAISAAVDSYAMAIGTNNGGASVIERCFWLTGTAPGGGYYRGKGAEEITDSYNDTDLSALAYLSSQEFLRALNGDGRSWVLTDTSSYPLPRAFTVDTAQVVSVEKTSDPERLTYVAGQSFDPAGLSIYANYSDDTREPVLDYHINPSGALTMEDTEVTITGTFANHPYRYVYPVQVVAAELTKLRITTEPDNCLYASDEVFSPAGMVVQAFFSNAPQTGVVLAYDAYTWQLEGSTLTVSYTYGDKTCTASCEIVWLDTKKPEKNAEGFYQLACENDMLWFANQVNALENTTIKGILMADISMQANSFIGIGTTNAPFIGIFDGNAHTITLQLQSSGAAGLFAVAGAAYIYDLAVEGSITTTAQAAGAAGIVGYVPTLSEGEKLFVVDCVNRAKITAAAYGGGIVGKSITGAVKLVCCRNEGTLCLSHDYGGGIAGYVAGGLCLSAV